MSNRDFYWMNQAIEIASQSGSDWPIASIIVRNNEIIAHSRNMVEATSNPIAHAEILCIEQASKVLGKYLDECTMYCTLEPCDMCIAAIRLSRLERVIFGTFRPINKFDYNIDIVGGILESKCNGILAAFRPNLYSST